MQQEHYHWIDDLEYRSAIDMRQEDNTTILTVRDYSKSFTDVVIAHLLWQEYCYLPDSVIIFIERDDEPFVSRIRGMTRKQFLQQFSSVIPMDVLESIPQTTRLDPQD